MSGTIRDIAIIVIAVEAIVINALLVILVWQIWRLVKMFQNEVKPIIQDTQDTVGTVRGTATFVSQNIVNPVAKAGGKVAGARRFWQVLTAELRPQRSPTPPVDGG